jgi:hypothetical protein
MFHPRRIYHFKRSYPPTPTVDGSAETPFIDLPDIQVPLQTTGELTETDACKLFDIGKATLMMGDPVTPPTPVDPPEYSVCPFFTQKRKAIYVSVTRGGEEEFFN